MGHLLMENRHGLVVDARLSQAYGTAARDTAVAMIGDLRGRHPITLGADKAYDVASFVASLRDPKGDPACSPERDQPKVGDRRSHHPASRL